MYLRALIIFKATTTTSSESFDLKKEYFTHPHNHAKGYLPPGFQTLRRHPATATMAPSTATPSALPVSGYTAKSGPLTNGCHYDPKGTQTGVEVGFMHEGTGPKGTYGDAIARCRADCDKRSTCRVFAVLRDGVKTFGRNGQRKVVSCSLKDGPHSADLVDCNFETSKFLVVYEKDPPQKLNGTSSQV